jgi:alpha-D-xyloside xylohydrolase
MLLSKDSALYFTYDSEYVQIEAWGPNALRVRATKFHTLPPDNWALNVIPPKTDVAISVRDDHASISNGNICAVITKRGHIVISNGKGERILEESQRHRDVEDTKNGVAMVGARDFKRLLGGDYHLTYRLNSSDRKEKIYGMGQHQQSLLDTKVSHPEKVLRSSQSNVPFMLSNLGYGMLWNNPAVGRAVLERNTMTFEAYSTRTLDYWIVACDTPTQIIESFADVTGKVPMMPEYGLGFWQCKLRYQTQEELLDVAREYRKRGRPLDVIVVDFFHCMLASGSYSQTVWMTNLGFPGPKQGEWKFDQTTLKDPVSRLFLRSFRRWTELPARAGHYPTPFPISLMPVVPSGRRASSDISAG